MPLQSPAAPARPASTRVAPTGSFDPEMVGRMVAAYGAAVALVEDPRGVFALTPSDALHARIADAVFREACTGVEDVHRLKAAALRAAWLDDWQGTNPLAS